VGNKQKNPEAKFLQYLNSLTFAFPKFWGSSLLFCPKELMAKSGADRRIRLKEKVGFF
jgi:hypothetical protein